jgi:diaminopimelate epimerase
MPVTFQKMHGAGNDFVLLDLRAQSMAIDSARAREIADRRTGVGCDQLLILKPAASADAVARFEVWNADGSRAEQCGNGVRCIGLYLARTGEVHKAEFRLEAPTTTVSLACLDNGQVRVDMGTPEFSPSRVPLDLEPVAGRYTLDLSGGEIQFGAVSMGNPHAVVLVEDLERTEVGRLGTELGSHPAFPEGCNVGFVQVLDRENVRLRVFERGAGETQACGSGACAAVAVLAASGKLGTSTCVNQAGGRLIIGWHGGQTPVAMTGPAKHVFEGKMR